jgi:hypothetical protein
VLLVSLLALLTLLVISTRVVVASLGAMSAARADPDVISTVRRSWCAIPSQVS